MESRDTFPAEALEWRRFRALDLRQAGWSRRDIAEALGVSPVTVSRWCARARDGGPEALRARPCPGRPPKLTPAERRSIPEFLWHGAEAYGFRGEVWTCARVAEVIEEEFGVRYHKGHVSRLLRELQWTPQIPIRRAIQRDEPAIRRWREAVWPGLRRRARREHLSVMGGMTPEGRVYVLARQRSLNGLDIIEFLLHLGRVAGERLLVIWDGSPIHRRAGVNEFVSETRGKVSVEALPGYAPDLNPWDEGGWHHLKDVEMRNLVCRDLEELHQELHLAIARLRQKSHLVRSFFAQAGLEIPKT